MSTGDDRGPPPGIARGVRLAALKGGCVAYDVDRDRVFVLNASAAVIVALCDGVRPAAEIVSTVARLADGLDEREVRRWLDRAAADGIVVAGGAGAAALPQMTVDDLKAASSRLRDDDDTATALECLRLAVEQDPDDPASWMELGELAHIEGRRDLARDAYRRYLDLVGDDPEVAHILVALSDEAPPARAPDDFVRGLYARFAGFYDDNMRRELEYRGPEALIQAVLAADPGRTALRVLDLGCGSGLLAPLVRDRAARLVGVDLSPDMLALARHRRLYDELVEAEVGAYLEQCPPATFDLALACDVLIYFGDLEPVMGGAARAVVAGGLVAFTVEDARDDAWRLTDSGRYAHGRSHLLTTADRSGLALVSLSTDSLRQEYGEPVASWVAVFRKR